MTELRHRYRAQLAALEDRVLGFGDRIGALLEDAVAGLLEGDDARAETVVRAEARLVPEHRAFEEDVFRTLALQAPVAGELRLVGALTHVNFHAERMGRLCVNVARAAREVEPDGDEQLRAQIGDMAQHARRVVGRAFDAFARRDTGQARALHDLDDPVDRLNRAIFRRAVELATGGEPGLEWALRMILVARNLERIGDHAVAVGDQTVFVVEGRPA
jgi:phosphate transport system protein